MFLPLARDLGAPEQALAGMTPTRFWDWIVGDLLSELAHIYVHETHIHAHIHKSNV